MTLAALALNQFTATVHAADGDRFVASAPSRVVLVEQVACYIRERCDDVLWPAAAAEVHSLIAGGLLRAAIATYFANVGQRWDAEWLELGGLPFTDALIAPRSNVRDVACFDRACDRFEYHRP